MFNVHSTYVRKLTAFLGEEALGLNVVRIEPAAAGGVFLVAMDGHSMGVIHDETGTADAPASVVLTEELRRALRPSSSSRLVQENDSLVQVVGYDTKPLYIQPPVEQPATAFPDWRRPIARVQQECLATEAPVSQIGLPLGAFARFGLGEPSPCLRLFPGPDPASGMVVRLAGAPYFFGILMPKVIHFATDDELRAATAIVPAWLDLSTMPFNQASPEASAPQTPAPEAPTIAEAYPMPRVFTVQGHDFYEYEPPQQRPRQVVDEALLKKLEKSRFDDKGAVVSPVEFEGARWVKTSSYGGVYAAVRLADPATYPGVTMTERAPWHAYEGEIRSWAGKSVVLTGETEFGTAAAFAAEDARRARFAEQEAAKPAYDDLDVKELLALRDAPDQDSYRLGHALARHGQDALLVLGWPTDLDALYVNRHTGGKEPLHELLAEISYHDGPRWHSWRSIASVLDNWEPEALMSEATRNALARRQAQAARQDELDRLGALKLGELRALAEEKGLAKGLRKDDLLRQLMVLWDEAQAQPSPEPSAPPAPEAGRGPQADAPAPEAEDLRTEPAAEEASEPAAAGVDLEPVKARLAKCQTTAYVERLRSQYARKNAGTPNFKALMAVFDARIQALAGTEMPETPDEGTSSALEETIARLEKGIKTLEDQAGWAATTRHRAEDPKAGQVGTTRETRALKARYDELYAEELAKRQGQIDAMRRKLDRLRGAPQAAPVDLAALRGVLESAHSLEYLDKLEEVQLAEHQAAPNLDGLKALFAARRKELTRQEPAQAPEASVKETVQEVRAPRGRGRRPMLARRPRGRTAAA